MPSTLYLTEPYRVEIREEPSVSLGPRQARAKTLYSGLSHGTEMNTYRGRTNWGLPSHSGYSAVGQVVEVGSEFTGAKEGDILFQYAPHGTEFILSESSSIFHVPAGLDP